MSGNFSLESLLSSADPAVRRFIARQSANNYQEWVHELHIDIDSIILSMQRNSNYYRRQNDSDDELAISQCEDSLTHFIVSSLCICGYQASHDSYNRGHPDIKVVKENYVWLGEAKIYTGYQKLFEGYDQLTTRYTTGEPNENLGGMLIYYYVERCSEPFKEWERKLKERNADLRTESCSIRPKMAFISTEPHRSTGYDYVTRHMSVTLHYKPDK